MNATSFSLISMLMGSLWLVYSRGLFFALCILLKHVDVLGYQTFVLEYIWQWILSSVLGGSIGVHDGFYAWCVCSMGMMEVHTYVVCVLAVLCGFFLLLLHHGCVYHYAIFNDMGISRWQSLSSQFWLWKSTETLCNDL